MDQRLPERSQQAVLSSLEDATLREVVDRYVDAWERADVDAVVAMLTADGVLAMPPHATWFRGREAVAAFLAAVPMHPDRRWRMIPVRANGQLAFATYGWDEEREIFLAHGISVLTLDGTLIADFTNFLDAELIPRFGLPAELEP